ncbi:MAG TPA: hypothetical protein VF595_01350 [Tepidisphaeraceae bacterium]|jgi:predicted Na+-dependent transporter
MTRRLAACLGLIAFATCLVQGLFAENSFPTVVWRALQALVVTLIVGLTLGVMFEKMLSENLAKPRGLEDSAADPESVSR